LAELLNPLDELRMESAKLLRSLCVLLWIFLILQIFEQEVTEGVNWRDFQAVHWPHLLNIRKPEIEVRAAPPFPLFSIDSKPPHGFSPFGHVAFTPVQTTYKPSVVLLNSSIFRFLNRSTQSGPIGGFSSRSLAFE
jgi:hypothetical protein